MPEDIPLFTGIISGIMEPERREIQLRKKLDMLEKGTSEKLPDLVAADNLRAYISQE